MLNPYSRNFTAASSVTAPTIGNKANHVLALTHNGENVGALSLLPDANSAVMVLENTTTLGDFTDLIAQMLIQEVPGLSDSNDYVALAERIVKECSGWHERALVSPLRAHRISGTSVGKLEDYVGVYSDPNTHALISVTLNKEDLFFHRGALESQQALLSHYHYKTFSFSTTSYNEHMKFGLIDYDNWKQLLIEFERGVSSEVISAKWLPDQDLSPFFLKKIMDN